MTQHQPDELAQKPIRKIPAAKIQFLPEDRVWIAERIQEILATGQLTLGQYGTAFEQKFAQFCGVKHAIAVNSGTSSIEIILRALRVEGKDVLVPTNTFFATAAAIIHAGGNPVFVDMDPESFSIHPRDVEKCLTSKTAGIIMVHIGGIVSAQTPALLDLAARKGIWLVEDAAHAHGSTYQGTSAGAFGIANSFSFYPTKVMTSAEGGMITTNDATIADEARIYRDQGKASFTQNAHIRMGYNWRMSEPHAIIGLKHLERLPGMISDRRAIAQIYDNALKVFRTLSALAVPAGGTSNYYKYIAILKEKRDRQALKNFLREQYGVSLAGEVYEAPLHQQPIFEKYAHRSMPISEDLCARHICLPIFSGMENADANHVIAALREVLESAI